MAAAIFCPECGSENTIRKGVCFRCGYREPKPASIPKSSVSPTPSPPVVVPKPVPFTGPAASSPQPPSSTPTTSGPLPSYQVPPGATSGKITAIGAPRTEVMEPHWGDSMAKVAGVLAIFVALVVGVVLLKWIVALLLPLIVILIIPILLFPRITGLMSHLVPPRLGPRGQRSKSDRQDIEIPVTPFTVTSANGAAMEVVLRGELHGGSLHLGDSVEVSGKALRDGTFQAHAVLNTVTHARTTVRQHPVVVRSRIKAIASLFCIIVLAVMIISLFQSFNHM